MKRISYSAAMGVLLIVLPLGVIFVDYARYTIMHLRSPWGGHRHYTRGLINLAYIDLLRRFASEPEALVLLNPLPRTNSAMFLNRSFALLRHRYDLPASNALALDRAIPLTDSWGSPLNVALTNSNEYLGLNSKILGTSNCFVIWSSGLNRSNEFGFGDDIGLPRSKIDGLQHEISALDHQGIREVRRITGNTVRYISNQIQNKNGVQASPIKERAQEAFTSMIVAVELDLKSLAEDAQRVVVE